MFNQDIDFNFFIKLLFSLIYVPVDSVVHAYDTVVLDFYDNHRNDESWTEMSYEIDQFLAYFERTWVGSKSHSRSNVRREPLFAHSNWNKHQAVMDGEALTNNFSESFNHGWTSSLERRLW